MSKPQLLSKEQQSELVGKLLEMLGLPPLVKYLKIEWSVGRMIEIECQSFLDSQIPAIAKERGEQP